MATSLRALYIDTIRDNKGKTGRELAKLLGVTSNTFRANLSRFNLRLRDKGPKSFVTTTGKIRAKLEAIRASTNDLEMLSACAIMADIISEIEDE